MGSSCEPHRATILLVEDHPDVLLAVSQALMQQNLIVISAASPAAAVDVLRSGPSVDLLIIDQHIRPLGSAHQLVAEARSRRSSLPVIATQARAVEYPIPAATVLMKPFKLAALLQAIADLTRPPEGNAWAR